MKIYISGQITGNEGYAKMHFDVATFEIFNKGFSAVNPFHLNHDHDKSWESYMKEDIAALCGCDAIYMLDNWYKSRGAGLEKLIAEKLGLKVFYEKNGIDAIK
jgi:hypothetical protein